MSPASPPAPDEARAQGHVEHVDQGAYEFGYVVLAALFVAVLMLTNVIGTKLFELPLDLPLVGPLLAAADWLVSKLFEGQGGGAALTLTAGIITYPATFLFTDIVSEIYGRKRADRMVIMGFCASLFMLAVFAVGKALPASPFWVVPDAFADVFHPDLVSPDGRGGSQATGPAAQAAYAFTFDAPGMLLFASMAAYLAAQLVDNRLFHFWRRISKGRHLWLRNNASTAVSQLVDTIIVNSIFLHFHFHMEAGQIGAIIVSSYVVKWLMALFDTPLCYAGVYLVARLVRTPDGKPRTAGRG